MAYDRRHILAQWGGTLPGGEIWSNSLRLASSVTGPLSWVPTQSELIAWLEGPAKDAVAAFHTSTGAHLGMNAKLAYLKMNVVDMNGHYVEQTTHEYVYSPQPFGNSNAVVHPTQVALVVSTTTAYARGPAHRGRFYLPLPAIMVTPSTGLISVTDAQDVAASAATFISALHDQPGIDPIGDDDMHVCVMSRGGAGATNRVTGVDVGLVLDTQRRRRNALPENYQHADLP